MAETTEDVKPDDQNELIELVEDLKRSNADLEAELDVFERFVSRMDPRVESDMASQTGTSRGRKTRSRTPEKQHRLTWQQRCDVIRSVHQHASDALKRLERESHRALEIYQATLEEAEIHLAEVKSERCQFDRDVGKTLRDRRILTMSAEKVIRYFEDRIRAKENLMDKFHRKNAAFLAQKRKLRLQLKQQEEMGEGLTPLDFEQLKIENIKSRKRLDEQNQKHLELKLLAGRTSQALNSHKEKLQTLMQESDVLSGDVSSRMKLLVKIEEETKHAEQERSKAEALNRKLRNQLANFQVPHVLQYISIKDSHSQLEKNVRTWERKVEIAEMALKTYAKIWDKLRVSAGVGPALV